MNTFKHSGGFGDLILGLPIVMQLGNGIFYLTQQEKNVLGELLDVQPYITKTEVLPFEEWKNIEVTHNLDLFRASQKESLIAKMYLEVFKMNFNLSQKWLFNIKPNKVAKIVIHDTGSARFPGHTVDWNVLKDYRDDCVFIGYDNDYRLFQERKLDIKRHEVSNLFEYAKVIEGCDLFIGNSSCPYTIAEGLKKALVIDLYIGKPQYPFGENGHTELTREIIERYLDVGAESNITERV